MIGYVDAQGEDVGTQVSLIDDLHGHVPIPANHHERLRCAVCKLEEGWMKVCGMKANYGQGSRQQRHMAVCSLCGISAHSLRVEWERKIHIIEPLAKMSCFQIAHSSYCTGLWTTRGQEVETFMRACYYVNTSHQVYQSIMESYGLIRDWV